MQTRTSNKQAPKITAIKFIYALAPHLVIHHRWDPWLADFGNTVWTVEAKVEARLK